MDETEAELRRQLARADEVNVKLMEENAAQEQEISDLSTELMQHRQRATGPQHGYDQQEYDDTPAYKQAVSVTFWAIFAIVLIVGVMVLIKIRG
jgi:hypothetical protein